MMIRLLNHFNYVKPFQPRPLKLGLIVVLLSSCLININTGIASNAKLGEESNPLDQNQISPAKNESSEGNQLYMPLVNGYTSYKPGLSDGSWPMAGANPRRNSWTSEEVRGHLIAEWFKPFEPYIMQKVQIIADYEKLYISTAKGLYALKADTGEQVWVYPTEMPLGHSPTIHEGVAYVGGFDHKLHAVNAHNGDFLWSFTANAGFDTNPLVVNDVAYLGNRDGYFYAINIEEGIEGSLAWKFKTNGPIHYSAAYQNGKVYFASNDSHAYALDAESGELVWKSARLPGAGFHSWWPVIYGDKIIFAGSNNYRVVVEPGLDSTFPKAELGDIFPHHKDDPRGTLVGPLGTATGDWAVGTPTIDASKATHTSNGSTTPITEYFEWKKWRRTYFVLDLSSGVEETYDFDADGKLEYAPILWLGNDSGNRYPPVVGLDGVLYQGNNYYSDPWIAGGHISGWRLGTPNISLVSGGWNAVDEPIAYSGGGSLIYWSRCCDRIAGAFDITLPVQSLKTQSGTKSNVVDRSWTYFSYDLPNKVPGYNSNTYVWDPYFKPYGGVFGGRNGSYGFHGDVNPPIPYQGKVYIHRGNSIIAFSPGKKSVVALPQAAIAPSQDAGIPPLTDEQIIDLLEIQIEAMIAAGHLRPGYSSTGFLEFKSSRICGADLLDYFHNPADTIYTLIRALPYLSEPLLQQTKDYLELEFDLYPPYEIEHIGWRDGNQREAFILPPDVNLRRAIFGPAQSIFNYTPWSKSPFRFYALWKYAEIFGDAASLFNQSKGDLAPLPADSKLVEMPHLNNVFIAGYMGYLELEKLATGSETPSIRNKLNHLLNLRVTTFSKESANSFFVDIPKYYCRSYNSAQNFMFMVPELAEHLRNNALAKVQDAVNLYEEITPLWFATNVEAAFAEGTINHLYDVNAIFQAKTLILDESREEMTKYLDVPAFPRGDLFYIQNLVSLLETSP
jgi:hypothetical protein